MLAYVCTANISFKNGATSKVTAVPYYQYNATARPYVMVVTWARGIYLICMPEARGPQARGLRAYISGESRAPMLPVICITTGTLKICPNLQAFALLFI